MKKPIIIFILFVLLSLSFFAGFRFGFKAGIVSYDIALLHYEVSPDLIIGASTYAHSLDYIVAWHVIKSTDR